MPLKSWTWSIDGHTLRAEIWWRFTGWYRKRLFVDHRRVDAVRGRFALLRPLKASQSPLGPITARFTPRRFGLDMDCAISGERIPTSGLTPAIEKRFRHSVYDEGIDKPPSPLGCFIFIPIVLVLWTVAIPLSLLGLLFVISGFPKRAERRFERRMRRADRFLDWPEIEQRLQIAPSTLIMQRAQDFPRY
jgi:hypothetical protein